MNNTSLFSTLWQLLNAPAAIVAIALLALWLLNRVYAARPAWRKYEGAIITGIKLAEKNIPDGTPNKGLARLDAALRYVLSIHREVEQRRPTNQELADLREGVQITHAKLESQGNL